MTIISNSDALSASRDEKSRIVDRIRQLGQWIVSTSWRVDKWWTEARLAREDMHDLSRLNEHMLRDIGLTRNDPPGTTPGRGSFGPWRD